MRLSIDLACSVVASSHRRARPRRLELPMFAGGGALDVSSDAGKLASGAKSDSACRGHGQADAQRDSFPRSAVEAIDDQARSVCSQSPDARRKWAPRSQQ
jgi:hypothetical protein